MITPATVGAPRGPANRRAARSRAERGRPRRVRVPSDTARNDNNRTRRVPPVERAPPEETRRLRAALGRTACAALYYYGPRRLTDHFPIPTLSVSQSSLSAALLYYHYHYHYYYYRYTRGESGPTGSHHHIIVMLL